MKKSHIYSNEINEINGDQTRNQNKEGDDSKTNCYMFCNVIQPNDHHHKYVCLFASLPLKEGNVITSNNHHDFDHSL